MSDRVQIGPTVDEDLWKEFRKNVKARKGQVRGVLGDELEKAIRQYIDGSPDNPSRRIDSRLARIENELGIAATDGSGDTLEQSSHAHTPSRLGGNRKPPANAATDKKIAYLAQCVRGECTLDSDKPGEIPESKLREIVKDEYGFRKDTAKRYVEELINNFGLRDHPNSRYDLLVTEPKYKELIEEKLDE